MALLENAVIDVIEATTGIVLAEEQVEKKLLPLAGERALALGLRSGRDYLEHLSGESPEGAEWARVIETLTNGQTSFFRDADQFEAIGALLRDLARSRGGRPIEIWSAGCSTGEEPYSVAILAAELGVPVRILATDINPAFLERAAAARFEAWALRKVDAARRERWFERTGGGFRPREPIRALVRLRRHNLVRDPAPRSAAPGGRWDLVLCRNVFLYFRRGRIRDACRKLGGVLAPGGRLLLAASESLHGLELSLWPEVVGQRIAYRAGPPPDEPRQAHPPPGAPDPAPPAAPVRAPEDPPPAPPAGGTGSLLSRVATLAADGELERARRLLEERRELGVVELLALGHLHLAAHEMDAALEAYGRAAAEEPLLCETHYFQGLGLRKTGAWTEAAEALRRALFLAPTFWQASYLLSGAYERLGRVREATRERARTKKLLAEGGQTVAFLSPKLFVDWFSVAEDEVRRIWKLSRSRSP